MAKHHIYYLSFIHIIQMWYLCQYWKDFSWKYKSINNHIYYGTECYEWADMALTNLIVDCETSIKSHPNDHQFSLLLVYDLQSEDWINTYYMVRAF